MSEPGLPKSPGRKRKLPGESPDRRLARTASKPSQAVQDRIERAFTHRLYLLRREATVEREGYLHCDFHVLGNTGNAYKVTISRQPSCTCPDSMKGNVCKHRLFVLLRVLKCEETNPVLWQKALLAEELREVLGRAAADIGGNVLADACARAAFALMTSQSSQEATSSQGGRKQREVEGDCPVCYEPLVKDREAVVFCRTCGNNIHDDCFRRWKNSKDSPSSVTCVWCRSPWEETSSIDPEGEGFLNLAQYSQQHRDDPDPALESVYPESYMSIEGGGYVGRRKRRRGRW